jgi:hypothetical protein
MVTVQRLSEGDIKLRLSCVVCGAALCLDDCVLAFTQAPTTVQLPAYWLHRRCLTGNRNRLFGTPIVTTWSGREAMQRLAQGLQRREEAAE